MQRGLAETRERAQSYVLSGRVSVNGQPATRPALSVRPDDDVSVQAPGHEWVSRGAYKLLAGLDHWPVDVRERVAIDVGASTGGFTEVLLSHGARLVYAVDVGTRQLHQRLRDDPRVLAMERTNIRDLASLPDQPDLAVADVSFISLRLALPPVFPLLRLEAPILALVKPQFEAGRAQVGRGGVVRDARVHRQVLTDLAAWSATQPWRLTDAIPSPIRGPAGNVEFVSLWRGGAEPLSPERAQAVVEEAAHAIARSG